MVLLDTSVLVHAADEGASEHEACRALLERLRRGVLPWYATWGILYEFLRVVTHPGVFGKPWRAGDAWRFAEALLASPRLTLLTATPRHAETLSLTFREIPDLRGNLLHDAHTAVRMREHGIRRIYTRDADFNRFPFLEVVDPLREA